MTHMFYTAWPDHGVPRNTMSLISFIHRVRQEHPTSLATPLLVHCSAGVGRTGTFILLDLAMQQMRSQGALSVFQHLKNTRTQRMKMVQTLVSVAVSMNGYNMPYPMGIQYYQPYKYFKMCRTSALFVGGDLLQQIISSFHCIQKYNIIADGCAGPVCVHP